MTTTSLAPNSILSIMKKAVACNETMFEELWQYGMEQVKPTRNPMNSNQFILHRQALFTDNEGTKYSFSGHTSVSHGPINKAPQAVQACHAIAQKLSRRFGVDPANLTGVHVNWYPDCKAALGSHQDQQPDGVDNPTIFSFTFIGRSSSQDPDYRDFLITKTKTKFGKKPADHDVVARCQLKHGDLAIMHGKDFQKRLWHEVPKVGKKFKNVRLTFRVWGNVTSIKDGK